jgi:hypothetical protein
MEWEKVDVPQSSTRRLHLRLHLVGVDAEYYLEIFFHYGWNMLVMERCIWEKGDGDCFKFDGLEKIKDVDELIARFPGLEKFRDDLQREIFRCMLSDI